MLPRPASPKSTPFPEQPTSDTDENRGVRRVRAIQTVGLTRVLSARIPAGLPPPPRPASSALPQVVVVVQSLSHVQLLVTPWAAALQTSLSFTISQSLLKVMSIKSVMPSHHLILCCPPLLLPSVFLSIRVFSKESVLYIRWPKYWRFNINPSNDYSGFISFRIDWFDLLAVQGTLKSLLQHYNSKASILQCSAFFIVQLSHP